MDGRRKIMDNPNMYAIPTYALYGEDRETHPHDWLHWETIPARSRLHGWQIQPHRHDHLFQILVLTAGRGTLKLDMEIQELTPNSIAILSPLSVHGFEFSEDVDGIVLTLRERDLKALRLEVPPSGVIGPEASPPVLKTLDDLIAEAEHRQIGHDVAMQARIALMIVELARVRSYETALRGGKSDPAQRHAKAFRELVEKRFRETRSVADYASEMGISQTHLGRVCREVIGLSPLALIEQRVVLDARRYLLFTNLSVKDIGGRLGYDDPGYFTRMLTRALGQSPSAFRKAAIEANATAASPPSGAPAA